LNKLKCEFDDYYQKCNNCKCSYLNYKNLANVPYYISIPNHWNYQNKITQNNTKNDQNDSEYDYIKINDLDNFPPLNSTNANKYKS
jgi:hypothetical protein